MKNPANHRIGSGSSGTLQGFLPPLAAAGGQWRKESFSGDFPLAKHEARAATADQSPGLVDALWTLDERNRKGERVRCGWSSSDAGQRERFRSPAGCEISQGAQAGARSSRVTTPTSLGLGVRDISGESVCCR